MRCRAHDRSTWCGCTADRQGALHARALGRAMPLDMPHPGTVQVTMGFADPAANQCAVMKAPLRPARAGGLRSP
jgi:hypothetical protein